MTCIDSERIMFTEARRDQAVLRCIHYDTEEIQATNAGKECQKKDSDWTESRR